MRHSPLVVNPSGGAEERRVLTQPALHDNLMGRIVDPANMRRAWKRVKANQGAPGSDGMTLEDFPTFARLHWSAIRQALLDGAYQPQPVRRVSSTTKSSQASPVRIEFEYIHRMRRRFERAGSPVVSIDTKKKEMLGRFKNPGTTWETKPVLVNDHDFKRDACGVAIPWGLYETQTNQGHVFIGTAHDTPAFAVTALARWWTRTGRWRYPQAKRLLILADCGGQRSSMEI